MRRLVDQERLLHFMRELGRLATADTRIYLTGGASAVILEWRAMTIDVDLEIRPESDEILRAIPRLKEDLEINVGLASGAARLAGAQSFRRMIDELTRRGE